ncbi:MAG: flagellar protein [Clostridiales bacterium]|nr:flagellar protein [Clostridiales bacterium]
MEVMSCKGCGRLFNFVGGTPLCEACKRKLEEKFQEVKQYLRDNPGATIAQVSEEMDVAVKQIKQWIREERLALSDATVDGIVCEHCGIPIKTGRFCDKCKIDLTNTFASAIDKPKVKQPVQRERDGNRMRFLQK